MHSPHYAHFFTRRTGHSAPVIAGLLVVLLGAVSAFRSVGLFMNPSRDSDLNLAAMYVIGGLFLLLTGLWFMTRDCLTRVRVTGLIIMVCGVTLGTFVGTRLIDPSSRDLFEGANLAFLVGLLVHLAGVIYVVRARE